jgi:hypothetical protein
MGADDPFDTFSGTHGLTGAADTLLMFKRAASGVTLYARGRGTEEAELAVQFSKETCRWTILGQAVEVHRSDERNRVIETLRKAEGPPSGKNIVVGAELKNGNAGNKLLFKMAEAGEIERVGYGKYALPSAPSVSSVRPVRTGHQDGQDADKSTEKPPACLTARPATALKTSTDHHPQRRNVNA